MTFTAFFGDTPRARLLDFLGDHPGMDYNITELAEKSGVSRPTVYAELPRLEDLGMIEQVRTVGQSRMFKLNTASPIVREVLSADMEAARRSPRRSRSRAKTVSRVSRSR